MLPTPWDQPDSYKAMLLSEAASLKDCPEIWSGNEPWVSKLINYTGQKTKDGKYFVLWSGVGTKALKGETIVYVRVL